MNILDTSSPIYIEKSGHTGRIVLNRPDRRNALTEAMWLAFPPAVAALDADPAVKVITVVSSSAGAFAAGADIEELEDIATHPDRRESNRLAIRRAQLALAHAEKPTIAQISGPCVGGGCGLALHCDMRIASEDARLGITPAKLGIVYPLSDTKRLVDLVGPARAKLLLFTGRILKASEALSLGLVDDVVPEESLVGTVGALVAEIAAGSQYSVRHMKKFTQRIEGGQTDDDAETAAIFCDSQGGVDAKEGIRAFIEKRKAAFLWNGGA